MRTARIAKCTKQSGLLATPISRSVLGASSRAHRIKCSWFNTSSCRVNAAIRCDATHARRQRLVSLPTMNVQRQPHEFHDAVRLHATLCVVCIVYRAAHGVRRTSPQKVTMLMRLPSDDPALAICAFPSHCSPECRCFVSSHEAYHTQPTTANLKWCAIGVDE